MYAYPDALKHNLLELHRVLTCMLLEILIEVNLKSASLQKIHQ